MVDDLAERSIGLTKGPHYEKFYSRTAKDVHNSRGNWLGRHGIWRYWTFNFSSVYLFSLKTYKFCIN